MGKYKLKKPIYVSAEERRANQAIIDAVKQKFIKKTYKAQCTYKKQGSMQEYVASGYFIDEDDANSHFEQHLSLLNEVSGGKWAISNVKSLGVNAVEEEYDE